MRFALALSLVSTLAIAGCSAAPSPFDGGDSETGTVDASDWIHDACPRTDTCLDVCGDGVCTANYCCRIETCATCPNDCCPETGPHG